MRISGYTCCNDAIKNEFTLIETILSASMYVDEFVYVDGGSSDKTLDIVEYLKENLPIDLQIHHNKWEPRLGMGMTSLQKSIALSHCTGDWCHQLDADEVLHEDKIDTILDKEILSDLVDKNDTNDTDNTCIWLGTKHFYRDYDTYTELDPVTGNYWYRGKVYIVKNDNMYHHFSSDADNDALSKIDCSKLPDDKACSYLNEVVMPTMYHYGHVRSKGVYLKKKNAIERRYHPEWEDLKAWEWGGGSVVLRENVDTHPKVMEGRVNMGVGYDLEKLYDIEYVHYLIAMVRKYRGGE